MMDTFPLRLSQSDMLKYRDLYKGHSPLYSKHDQYISTLGGVPVRWHTQESALWRIFACSTKQLLSRKIFLQKKLNSKLRVTKHPWTNIRYKLLEILEKTEVRSVLSSD